MKKLIWTTVQRRVNDLVPLDINPRKISEAKRMKMIESLQRFGLVDIPVVDFDGTIVSGHQRLRALQAIGQGEDMIDVRYPNRKLTTLELKEYNLLANTHFGEFDTDVFEEYFSDVDVSALGFSIDDFKLPDFSTIAPEQEPVKLEAKEDDYEIPDEIKTDIMPGDLFEIGPHRLLCGDSTNADDVAKLLDGKKADLVYADPPYGIPIMTDFGFGERGGRAVNGKKFDEVIGNDKDYDPGHLWLFGDKICTWGANHYANKLPHNGMWLIWDKREDKIPERNQADCELAWYSEYRAARVFRHYWDGMLKASERGESRVHPTQKPIALAQWCFEKLEAGNIIADPFLGSGTTMVAAHQLARRCYGIEIDPKYCQVIVDRMLRLDPTLTITRNGQPYEPKR